MATMERKVEEKTPQHAEESVAENSPPPQTSETTDVDVEAIKNLPVAKSPFEESTAKEGVLTSSQFLVPEGKEEVLVSDPEETTSFTQCPDLYPEVVVTPHTGESFETSDEKIKAANSLFKSFDEEASKTDEFGNPKYESITATFYGLKGGVTVHLTKGIERDFRVYGSWNRAFTAFNISDSQKGYPSFEYKRIHGLREYEAVDSDHLGYEDSAGGWPVYDPDTKKLIGAFSICGKGQNFDSKLAKAIIISTGYYTEPSLTAYGSIVAEDVDAYNICDDHWLSKNPEGSWSIRKKKAATQVRSCEHKWGSVQKFYFDKAENPIGVCPLCERAKQPTFHIRKASGKGNKRVVVKPPKGLG